MEPRFKVSSERLEKPGHISPCEQFVLENCDGTSV